jgi:hypothetical protein
VRARDTCCEPVAPMLVALLLVILLPDLILYIPRLMMTKFV